MITPNPDRMNNALIIDAEKCAYRAETWLIKREQGAISQTACTIRYCQEYTRIASYLKQLTERCPDRAAEFAEAFTGGKARARRQFSR